MTHILLFLAWIAVKQASCLPIIRGQWADNFISQLLSCLPIHLIPKPLSPAIVGKFKVEIFKSGCFQGLLWAISWDIFIVYTGLSHDYSIVGTGIRLDASKVKVLSNSENEFSVVFIFQPLL